MKTTIKNVLKANVNNIFISEELADAFDLDITVINKIIVELLQQGEISEVDARKVEHQNMYIVNTFVYERVKELSTYIRSVL